MKTIAFAIGTLIVGIGITCSTVSASEMLKSMDGNWTGNGWAKRTARGPREKVRCRVRNDYIDAGRRLVVSGSCAVPGKKFDMNGTVSANVDGTLVKGRWSNPFGVGSTAVNGSLSESNALLSFSGPLRGSKKSVPQQMVWNRNTNGFVIINKVNETSLGNLKFVRN